METPTGGSILERARRYISEGFFVVVCVFAPPLLGFGQKWTRKIIPVQRVAGYVYC